MLKPVPYKISVDWAMVPATVPVRDLLKTSHVPAIWDVLKTTQITVSGEQSEFVGFSQIRKIWT